MLIMFGLFAGFVSVFEGFLENHDSLLSSASCRILRFLRLAMQNAHWPGPEPGRLVVIKNHAIQSRRLAGETVLVRTVSILLRGDEPKSNQNAPLHVA